MSSTIPISMPAYRVVGPDGETIPLTKESFEALQDMFRRRYSGSVIFDFKNGGIAGVEMTVRKVYK